jgi:putative heme-binding domain-containing protein
MRWWPVLVADASPRVRLEALLALANVPSSGAVSIGMRALDRDVDPLIDFALARLAILHKPRWYPEFQAGRLTFDGNSRRTAYALKAIRGDAVPTLVALVKNNKVPKENLSEVLQLIATLGNAEEQGVALNVFLDNARLSVPDRVRGLDTLTQMARERKTGLRIEAKRITPLYDSGRAELTAAAMRLTGALKLEDNRTYIEEITNNSKIDDWRRLAAIDALVDYGQARSIKQLERLAGSKEPYKLRRRAIVGLTALDLFKAAGHARVMMAKPPFADDEPSELVAAFLARKGGSQALAAALEQELPNPDSARIGLRVLVERGMPAPELHAVLQKAMGKDGAKRKLDSAEMKRWIGLVQSQGNAARGESVFRRAHLGCYQCHALGGAGGRVGPDLSAIGTSAQLDYLIESILLPGKVVREGYTTAHITTKDGRTFSGTLQRESKTEIVLRDPVRDEIVIAAKALDEKRVGGSLMPDGIDQSLTDAELADLIRFLSELGKPGPFAVTHRAFARRWQALDTAFQGFDSAALGKLLHEGAEHPWRPVYAKVAGELPLTELASNPETLILRCQLDVVSPGEFRFHLNDDKGIDFWIDGKQVAAKSRLSIELPRGLHSFIFRIDLRSRADRTLRLELEESKGQARWVDGK